MFPIEKNRKETIQKNEVFSSLSDAELDALTGIVHHGERRQYAPVGCCVWKMREVT